MKKNIWIINHYAGNMLFDKGGRHYWFAKYLKRNGYNPVVFVANTKHGIKEKFINTNKLWIEKKAEDIDVPFIYVKSSLYQDNGKERILNMVRFFLNVKKAAKEFALSYGKPDIIYASSVHPLTLVAGIQLAKYYNVKCICEARDLWPEAIVAYSKRINKGSLLAKMLYAGEKWIYKKANALIFTQEGGADYIKSQGWDVENGGPINMRKVFHINNGVDLEAFDSNLHNYWLEDVDLDDKKTFKIIYTGAIRRINNLGLILDTAKIITNPSIRFIIFGDGDELEALKRRIVEERIENVVFKGRINKQYIPSVDVRADVNLVHWEMNPLLKVGESYNKAFEYYAAGKPVFYTIRPGYSIAERFKSGCITEGFTPKDLACGLQKMAQMTDEDKITMGKRARKVAELYDFNNLTKKLIKIIER